MQRSEGGALGLGLSQDNFASTRSVGNFLTKSTAIIATLFIISSISLVILSRGDLQETQSVIEKIEMKKNLETPKIPESGKINFIFTLKIRYIILPWRDMYSLLAAWFHH